MASQKRLTNPKRFWKFMSARSGGGVSAGSIGLVLIVSLKLYLKLMRRDNRTSIPT
jgi:hypothetical protein